MFSSTLIPSTRIIRDRRTRRLLAGAVLATLAIPNFVSAGAEYSYSTLGTTYSPNFTELPYSTTTESTAQTDSTNPDTVANIFGTSTYVSTHHSSIGSDWNGWYVSGSTIRSVVGEPNATTGEIFSFSSTATNQALGAIDPSSVGPVYFGVELKNTTGSSINKLSLSFTDNLWYEGTQKPLSFGYYQDATNSTTLNGIASSLTNVSSLASTATPVSGTNTASFSANGTQSGTTTAPLATELLSSTLSLSTPVASGGGIWLVWSLPSAGTSQGIGINNLSIIGSLSNTDVWHNGSTWDTTSANWLVNGGTSPSTYTDGGSDAVQFTNTNVGAVTIQAAGVAPAGISVSNTTGTYQFLNAGGATLGIGGTGGLTMSGSATLDLSGLTVSNTYSGGTNVDGGTLVISSDGQLGATAGGLTLDTGGNLALVSSISSARPLTIGAGGGTLAVGSNSLTVSAPATLNGLLTTTGSGNVNLGGGFSGGTTATVAGSLNVGTGGSVTVGGTNKTIVFSNGIALNGDLVVNTPARFDFDGAFNYGGTGDIYILGSTVGAGVGGSTATSGSLPAASTLFSNLSSTAAGTITSNIVLNPANNGTNLTGNVAWTPGNITGANYQFASFVAAVGATSSGETLTVNGGISGDGDLIIGNNSQTGGGGGTLVLNGASTYTGNTLVNNAGKIIFGTSNALPAATNLVFSSLSGAGNSTLDLNGNSQTLASISYDGEQSTTNANLTITNSGSLIQNLTLNGSVTPGKGFGGVIAGNLNLIKQGSNLIKLGGVNTYTGSTTVEGGTLQITSGASLPSNGGVEVGGGNFGGNGNIGSAVTADSSYGGGTLFEGTPTATGSLTVNGNVTMSSGSTLSIKLAQPASGTTGTEGSDNDTLVLTGGTSFIVGGSSLQVIALTSTFNSPIPEGGYTYTIVDATAGSGAVDSTTGFANLNGGTTYNDGTLAYSVTYSSDEITLDLTQAPAAPEPASVGMLMLSGGAMLLRRRNRGSWQSHQGRHGGQRS